MKVAVMTDTNSGISVEEGKKLGVYVIPMPVLVDGSTYYEGVNLSREEFCRFMLEGRTVSTSQPSPGDVAAGSFTSRDEEGEWISMARSAFPGRDIRYDPLAFSIGSHVGPGAFGMAVSKRVPAWEKTAHIDC